MYTPKHAKGLKTKFNILSVAKHLFYENGYNKTSVKEICETSNVKPGNFTYYFPTKNDLVKEIFTELYMRTYSFVESKCDRHLSSIEKNVFTAYPYFLSVFKDAYTTRFYSEILHRESPYDYLGQNFKHVYLQFSRELNLTPSSIDLKNLIYADLGMRRELTIRFMENPNGQTVYNLVDAFYIYRARLMTMDESLMIEYLKRAYAFEQTHDHTDIVLLK